ncbi:MAG: hypothetical protein QXV85_10235 [Candidatus Bathyarchaeia archaeon]
MERSSGSVWASYLECWQVALGWFGLFAGILILVGASIITQSIFRLIGS